MTSRDQVADRTQTAAVVSLWRCFQCMSGAVVGHMRSLSVLQFFLKLVSVALFSWALAALLGWLLSLDGSPAIGNMALVGFAASPIGIASLLLIPTTYLGVVYFEQACILGVLADPAGRVLRAMLLATAKLPQLMKLAAIQISILLVINLPLVLVAAATYWLLLTDADINYYLTFWPPKFWLAVSIGGLLVVIAGVVQLAFVFRWFLAMPWMVIGNASAVEALRLSAEQRAARPIVWRSMLVWIFVRLVCSTVGLLGIGCLTYLAFDAADHDRTTSVSVTTALLVAHTLISTCLTSIDQCWHVAGKWHAYLSTGALRNLSNENEVQATLSRRRAIAFGLVVLLTSFFLGLASFQQALGLSEQHDVRIVAHRAGAAHAPENTLAALRLAIEARADAAEIDVQLSRDGTIFVVHDRDLKRLASVPLVVSQATDVQLRAVSINWPAPSDRPPEPLATLDEFLETARDKIRLSIELKYYGWNAALAERVVQLLRDKEMLDQCEIISLEYKAIEQVQKLEPKLRRGFLVSTSLGDITRLNVQLLSVSRTVFNDELRRKANSRKLQVAVWTIDSPETMFQMMVKGADEIVTNDPVAAAAVEQQYAELRDVELFLVRLRERLSQ